jgi:hypothetical protein
MDAPAQVRKEIDELLAAHDSCWSRLELRDVGGFWDATHPAPVYIGEEYAAPVIGWPELNKHWARLAARLRSAWMRSSIVALELPIPEIAVAVLLSEWRFAGIESEVEHDGECWVTALLRLTANGWRFFHYMEAPIFRGADGLDLEASVT